MWSLVEQYPELLVVVAVLFAEWLLPLPEAVSPARGCRALATAFSKKLIKKQSDNLLRLFGWLTLITYMIFIGIFLFIFQFIAPDDAWSQGLLLYFSLGYQATANQISHIRTSLLSQQKTTARTLLSQLSEFDTSKLSPLGVNKLALEALINRFLSEWLMPLLVFALTNGVGAFLYRALIEAQKTWFPLRHRFKDFGYAATFCKNVLETIPTWLLAPIYSVFKSSPGWLKLYLSVKPEWLASRVSSQNQLIWLCIVAAGCKCEMAGPVMLDNTKYTRPRLNLGLAITEAKLQALIDWNTRFRLTVMGTLIIIIFTLGVIS